MTNSQNNAGQRIQWGAMVTVPTGEADVEVAQSRFVAMGRVGDINRNLGEGTGRLMYRTVTYGEWTDDVSTPGSEWGVQYTWPGHGEVELCKSRADAEMALRLYRGAAAVELATRQVTYGEWWLATAAGQVPVR